VRKEDNAHESQSLVFSSLNSRQHRLNWRGVRTQCDSKEEGDVDVLDGRLTLHRECMSENTCLCEEGW
jgi:hypothetical protein